MACHVINAERPLIDPEVAITGHLDLPAMPKSTPLARHFVRQHLAGLSADVIDDCELLTSELVSNVILHARTRIHLGVSRDPSNVLVVVQDFSGQSTAQRTDVSVEGLAESGRGMAIVSSLADDFGWKRLPDQVGKIMWFAIGIDERNPSYIHGEDDFGEVSQRPTLRSDSKAPHPAAG